MEREKAVAVVDGLKKYFVEKYGDAPDFELHDHDKEAQLPGAWSINAEGWYDRSGEVWGYCLPDRSEYERYGIPQGILLEPIMSVIVGVCDA